MKEIWRGHQDHNTAQTPILDFQAGICFNRLGQQGTKMSQQRFFEPLETRKLLAAAAPTQLVATPTSSSAVELTWKDNAATESGYRIERSTDGVAYSLLNIIGANQTSYINGKLDPTKTYSYRVKAMDASGDSAYSNVASVQTGSSNLPAPTNLKVVATSSTALKITWADNANGETGYRIERSTDGKSFKLLNTTGANVTSYINGKLDTGVRHYYRVAAFDGTGNSAFSNVGSAIPTAPPSAGGVTAPSNLKAVATSATAIKLTWADNAGNETGYRIEISEDGSNFKLLNKIGANQTSYVKGKLASGVKVYFQVMAYSDTAESGYSNTASATPAAPPSNVNIAAPTDLKAVASSSTAINLTWKDNAGNETGYRVEISEDGSNFKLLNTVGANSTSYLKGKLTTGVKYFFRVAAFNVAGASGYSNVASAIAATPPSTTPPPAAPSGLTATSRSTTSVQLTWTDNANSETGFKIERSEDGVNFKQINVVGANVTSYINGKLITDKPYHFRVRAYHSADSGYSNVASATPAAPAIAPLVEANEMNTVALSSHSIRVTWSDNSTSETGYKIERSNSSSSGFVQIGVTLANAESYVDTGLQASKKYYYRVRPFNETQGNGPYSNSVGRTTLSPGAIPDWANGGVGEYATGQWFFDGVSVTLAADPAQTIPMLKQLHVGSVRIWFSRSESWDSPPADGLAAAKAYKEAGFRVMMVVGDDVVPTYDQAKAFFEYVANTQDILKYVDLWEIGNEPNIAGFWKGSAAEYVNLVLKPAYEVFHPLGETVVGAGPTWDVNYAKKLVTEGYLNYVDIANFHPYGSTPEEVYTRAVGARDAFAGKPILFSEWNIRNTAGKDAWAAKVDASRKLLATVGADSSFYFTMFVANTLAGPAGLISLEDYSANQPFFDMFKTFGEEPII